MDHLLGIDLQRGVEAEHADCLLLLYPADIKLPVPLGELSTKAWRARVPDLSFVGEPNRLSADHHSWPIIDEVASATRSTRSTGRMSLIRKSHDTNALRPLLPARAQPAEQITRQRWLWLGAAGGMPTRSGLLTPAEG